MWSRPVFALANFATAQRRYEGKLSRPVLSGLGDSDDPRLPGMCFGVMGLSSLPNMTSIFPGGLRRDLRSSKYVGPQLIPERWE